MDIERDGPSGVMVGTSPGHRQGIVTGSRNGIVVRRIDIISRGSIGELHRQSLAIMLWVVPCVVGERPGGTRIDFGEPDWLESKSGQSKKGWDRSEGPQRYPSSG